ncbi:hypothetical protein E2320_002246, partial [Naja naja]
RRKVIIPPSGPDSPQPPAQPCIPSQTWTVISEVVLSTVTPSLSQSTEGSAPSLPASVTPEARPWCQAPTVHRRGRPYSLGIMFPHCASAWLLSLLSLLLLASWGLFALLALLISASLLGFSCLMWGKIAQISDLWIPSPTSLHQQSLVEPCRRIRCHLWAAEYQLHMYSDMGLPMAAFSLYLTATTLLPPLHLLPCPLPNPGCYPPLPVPHESRRLRGPPLPCPASVSVWQAEGDSSTLASCLLHLVAHQTGQAVMLMRPPELQLESGSGFSNLADNYSRVNPNTMTVC